MLNHYWQFCVHRSVLKGSLVLGDIEIIQMLHLMFVHLCFYCWFLISVLNYFIFVGTKIVKDAHPFKYVRIVFSQHFWINNCLPRLLVFIICFISKQVSQKISVFSWALRPCRWITLRSHIYSKGSFILLNINLVEHI